MSYKKGLIKISEYISTHLHTQVSTKITYGFVRNATKMKLKYITWYFLTYLHEFRPLDINVSSIEISFFVKPFHPKAPWANKKLNSRDLSYKIRCHDG